MKPTILLILMLVTWPGVGICAEPAASGTEATGGAEVKVEADAQAKPDAQALPGIHIDREKKIVDLEAKVVLRQGDWLELLVCTPGTREYESILSTSAKPSHLQLALITLGLQPGAPRTARQVDGKLVVTPATGPRIAVTLVLEQDGRTRRIPANEWIIDRNTNKPMVGNEWLFVGSKFIEHEGESTYLADANGSVLSLVNFGDEVLARATELTRDTDNESLTANTDAIPEVGTKVIVRLEPIAAPEAGQDQKPAEEDGASE